MKHFLIGLFAALLALPTQAATPEAEKSSAGNTASLYAVLYGRWEGEVKGHYYESTEEKRPRSFPFRLEVSPNRVEFFNKTATDEWKSSGLKFSSYFTFEAEKNTLVGKYFRSGVDEDGIWVESQNIFMTLKDDNTLLLYWMRAVNNTDEKDGKAGTKWLTIDIGELHKYRE